MHEVRPGMNNPLPDKGDQEILVTLRCAAEAECLKEIRAAVGAAALRCGCAEEEAQDIVLAVDEACQNVIRHAYGGAPGGEMIVEVRRTGDGMEVSLTDFAETVDAPSTTVSSRVPWTTCVRADSAFPLHQRDHGRSPVFGAARGPRQPARNARHRHRRSHGGLERIA